MTKTVQYCKSVLATFHPDELAIIRQAVELMDFPTLQNARLSEIAQALTDTEGTVKI